MTLKTSLIHHLQILTVQTYTLLACVQDRNLQILDECFSFFQTRNQETHLQLTGAKTKWRIASVKGISWFRHFRSFPLFHGFHLNVDFTGNPSDPRSNFLHTQHREIVTICLFERASFNPLNERNGNKIIIKPITLNYTNIVMQQWK